MRCTCIRHVTSFSESWGGGQTENLEKHKKDIYLLSLMFLFRSFLYPLPVYCSKNDYTLRDLK